MAHDAWSRGDDHACPGDSDCDSSLSLSLSLSAAGRSSASDAWTCAASRNDAHYRSDGHRGDRLKAPSRTAHHPLWAASGRGAAFP